MNRMRNKSINVVVVVVVITQQHDDELMTKKHLFSAIEFGDTEVMLLAQKRCF